MRRYDEPIAVRRGLVGGEEAPEQFLWRGKLWVVREIVSHWVETGAWWEQSGVAALLGTSADPVGAPVAVSAAAGTAASAADLLGERDLWRVEARRGKVAALRLPADPEGEVEPVGYGVFDLCFDWSEGEWRLVGSLD